MRELLPGLLHWTAYNPNIDQQVSSYYVIPRAQPAEPAASPEGGATLLDPLLPEEGLAIFDGLPKPERVVLTCRHHTRDHERLREELGCTVHVPEAGMHEYEGQDVQPYAIGDMPAPGIVARAQMPIAPDDTALHIDAGDGVLAFADSIIRVGDEVTTVPDFLIGDDPERIRAEIREAARALLEERFDTLLFAHGDPLVGGGRAALEAFAD